MPSAEERFQAKIRRRGDHDIWTGFTDHRGVGMVRIDGKLRTVQRAAWELARGPLPQGARVNSCAGKRACVRVEHLSLSGTPERNSPPARRGRGIGSKRQLRANVWQLVVVEGSASDGKPLRRYRTVHGDENAASEALEALAAHLVRHDFGDLRVRELLDRYLHANNDPHSPGADRDPHIVRGLVEAGIGNDLAAFVTSDDIVGVLHTTYRDSGVTQARNTLGLIRDAYRWARRQGWTDHDPTRDVTLRSIRPSPRTPPT